MTTRTQFTLLGTIFMAGFLVGLITDHRDGVTGAALVAAVLYYIAGTDDHRD